MQPNTQTSQQPTPKEFFEQAKRLMSLGDVFEASKRAGKLRAHFPEEPPILAIHGLALAKLGVHTQGLKDMRASSALTLQALNDGEEEDPTRPRVVDQYLHLQSEITRSLTILGEFQSAHEEIQPALEMDPDRADVVCSLAELHSAQGDTDKALEVIDSALSRKLDELPVQITCAKVLDYSKNPDENRMRVCASRLSELSEEVGLLAGELMQALRALGTLRDRLGEYPEAFSSFRRAAKLRRGGFDPKAHAQITSQLIKNWTVEGISSATRPEGDVGASRVFLTGSVHSGMPEVQALLERLPNTVSIGPIESLGMMCSTQLKAARGVLRNVVPTPAGQRGDQINNMAMGYSQQCDAAARMSGLFTIDTHPHNLPLLGAAAMGLRGIKVINCRRDPIEHALSIYCDEMPGNHGYAGDLISTASFVKDSDGLMDHWTSVLNDPNVGAKVINVQYDQVLSDPVAVLRQLAVAFDVEVTDEMTAGLEPSQPTGPGARADKYTTANKQLGEFFSSES